MRHLRSLPGLLAAALLGHAGCSGDDGPPVFLELSLESALEKAGKEGKVVFLEFGATWCEPCKRLEATTLVDPRVRDWLAANTVPLHFDLDESVELASEFAVTSVPKMVFVRPDRSVLGSIVGYRDAATFLQEAGRRLEGVSAVDEAARAVLADPEDVSARQRHFEELLGDGKYPEALEQAEIYWKASRKSMAQVGVRLSFFLSSMGRLAKDHAPASKVMERWLGEARAALADPRADLTQAAMELASLAQSLKRPEVVLEVADELKGSSALMVLATVGGEILLEGRRYAVLVDAGVCEPEAVKSRIDAMQSALKLAPDANAEFARVMREMTQKDVARAVEALAGVGREADALAVAELALGGEDDAAARALLARCAERAGKSGLARKIRDGD